MLQKLSAIEEQIQALTILKPQLQGILCGWQEIPKSDQIARTICPKIQLNL